MEIEGRPLVTLEAEMSSKLVKDAEFKLYPGGSHALADTSKDQLNAEPPSLIKQ